MSNIWPKMVHVDHTIRGSEAEAMQSVITLEMVVNDFKKKRGEQKGTLLLYCAYEGSTGDWEEREVGGHFFTLSVF